MQVNAPYRPAWIGRVQGLRAVARLLPYGFGLWSAAGRADIVHVMANSGWSWHLFAAPAVWIGSLRRRPVVVNYHGGEAEAFLNRSAPRVRSTLARASQLLFPSGFLKEVFGRFGIEGRIVPNVVDLARFAPAENRKRGAHLVLARNLEPIYGIDTALRAFALVAAVRQPARAADLAALGVQVRQADYEQPETLQTAFAGAERITADRYVLAAGSYSTGLVKPLGLSLPVYPLKGYSITVDIPSDHTHAAPRVSVTDTARKVVFARLGERLAAIQIGDRDIEAS